VDKTAAEREEKKSLSLPSRPGDLAALATAADIIYCLPVAGLKAEFDPAAAGRVLRRPQNQYGTAAVAEFSTAVHTKASATKPFRKSRISRRRTPYFWGKVNHSKSIYFKT
jgi:hypothetical protein